MKESIAMLRTHRPFGLIYNAEPLRALAKSTSSEIQSRLILPLCLMLVMAISLSFSGHLSAFAQGEYTPNQADVRLEGSSRDANGFDRLGGGFVHSVELVSIGDPANGGLSLVGQSHETEGVASSYLEYQGSVQSGSYENFLDEYYYAQWVYRFAQRNTQNGLANGTLMQDLYNSPSGLGNGDLVNVMTSFGELEGDCQSMVQFCSSCHGAPSPQELEDMLCPEQSQQSSNRSRDFSFDSPLPVASDFPDGPPYQVAEKNGILKDYWKLSHWNGAVYPVTSEYSQELYISLKAGFEVYTVPVNQSDSVFSETWESVSNIPGYVVGTKAINNPGVSVLSSSTDTEIGANYMVLTEDGREIAFKDAIVSSITYPNGIVETYHYKDSRVPNVALSGNDRDIKTLKAVTTNAGYMLHFEYEQSILLTLMPTIARRYENGEPGPFEYGIPPHYDLPTRVVAINTDVYNCAPLADVCSTTQGGNWPYVDFNWSAEAMDIHGNASYLNSFTNSNGDTTTTFPEWRSPADPNIIDFELADVEWYEDLSNPPAYVFSGYQNVLPPIFWFNINHHVYDARINDQDWQYTRHATGAWSNLDCSGQTDGPEGYQASWTCRFYRYIEAEGLPVTQITSFTENGRTTTCEPDCNFRPVRITRPNGVIEEFEYDNTTYTGNYIKPYRDARNITKHTIYPKPGSSAAPIVQRWTYPTDTPTNRYTNHKTFNKPTAYTDPFGRVTNYTYDPVHGGLLTATRPAPGAGQYSTQNPKSTIFTADNGTGIYMPQTATTCAVATTCATSQKAQEIQTAWTYTAPHRQVQSLTVQSGDGALSSTVATQYYAQGDVWTVDGPLPGTGDTSYSYYDVLRRPVAAVAPDPDGSGPLTHPVTRTAYNADGNVTQVDAGRVSTPTNWNNLTLTSRVKSYYDAHGRKIKDEVIQVGGAQNGQIGAMTQYSYDGLGRIECTAQRMNPATFTSPPSNACALGTEGSQGPDRITKTEYTANNDVYRVIRAYGTPLQQNYQTYTYYPDGALQSVTDAKGNKTTYEYDGFNRLWKTSFPSKTAAGVSSTTDYEEYTYDAAGNRKTLRKRDGRVIAYDYDNLNRMIKKDVPAPDRDVYYDYDLRDLEISARFDSTSGPGLHSAYNALGQMKSATSDLTGTTFTYAYDDASNRTRVTHPDGIYFTYTPDMLSRLTTISDSNNNVLNQITYDAQGRLSAIDHTNRFNWSVGYDPLGRLDAMTIDADAGTAADLLDSFAYNPVGQLTERTRSNAAYTDNVSGIVSGAYTANGLDQYTSVAGAAFAHDDNGNMTSDGSTSYVYDVENRLTSVTPSGGSAVNLKYDPYGRLYEVAGSVTTRFVYDGDAMVEERDGANALVRRYVHGNGVDEPLVWYEGSTISEAVRRHLARDRQGSIIAVASSASSTPDINTYSPYGVPDLSNVGRFSYTGQMVVPEIDLLYYKARIYSPQLGRFLQTDPVGYQDQQNLYAYVGNDPMNNIDPSGKWCIPCIGAGVGAVANGAIYLATTPRSQWTLRGFGANVVEGAWVGGTLASPVSLARKIGTGAVANVAESTITSVAAGTRDIMNEPIADIFNTAMSDAFSGGRDAGLGIFFGSVGARYVSESSRMLASAVRGVRVKHSSRFDDSLNAGFKAIADALGAETMTQLYSRFFTDYWRDSHATATHSNSDEDGVFLGTIVLGCSIEAGTCD